MVGCKIAKFQSKVKGNQKKVLQNFYKTQNPRQFANFADRNVEFV